MGSHLSLRLLPALIVGSCGCMNCPCSALSSPLESQQVFWLLQPASCSSVRARCHLVMPFSLRFLPFSAVQSLCHVSSRLLEANRHLTAEGGAILLQRGATETPAGKGLLGDRAHHSTSPAPAVGKVRCQQPSSAMGYGMPWLRVSTA